MTVHTTTGKLNVGDWIEVDAPRNIAPRRGLVLEVLGRPGHERYRVRWDEAHESVVYPSGGARVIHPHSAHHPSADSSRPT